MLHLQWVLFRATRRWVANMSLSLMKLILVSQGFVLFSLCGFGLSIASNKYAFCLSSNPPLGFGTWSSSCLNSTWWLQNHGFKVESFLHSYQLVLSVLLWSGELFSAFVCKLVFLNIHFSNFSVLWSLTAWCGSAVRGPWAGLLFSLNYEAADQVLLPFKTIKPITLCVCRMRCFPGLHPYSWQCCKLLLNFVKQLSSMNCICSIFATVFSSLVVLLYLQYMMCWAQVTACLREENTFFPRALFLQIYCALEFSQSEKLMPGVQPKHQRFQRFTGNSNWQQSLGTPGLEHIVPHLWKVRRLTGLRIPVGNAERRDGACKLFATPYVAVAVAVVLTGVCYLMCLC